MEGPLSPWQFLMYSDESLPPYIQDLPPLYWTGPSHILLQIGLVFEGDYWGYDVVEEGREVEIENVE